jgi:hypothetical protein
MASNSIKYVRLMNQGTKNFKLNELKLLEKSKGFVRINFGSFLKKKKNND